MEYLKELHDLCKTISDAISESNTKIKASGGKLTVADVDYIDKLTHALKSVKATISMMEEEEEGYSNEGSYRGGDGSYNGGSYRGSYRGGSYRGRSYASRDPMSRYAGERGYSRTGLADELYDLMRSAPDEQTRREFERLIQHIEYRD